MSGRFVISFPNVRSVTRSVSLGIFIGSLDNLEFWETIDFRWRAIGQGPALKLVRLFKCIADGVNELFCESEDS